MINTSVSTTAAPQAVGPYSLGVWAGDFLFVSGQIPIDPATGRLVPGSAAHQMRQCLANVRAILEAAGCTLANVVKSTIFLTNMDDFAAVNDVYAAAFAKPYPARSCVAVARLPKEAQVELEVIATR